MRFVILSAAALLAGCASTQDVLSAAPTETFTTSKSVNEVAFCLADKNNTQALDQDDGSKVVLIKNAYNAVSLAFTIRPQERGSIVEYRKSFGTIGGVWRQCVED